MSPAGIDWFNIYEILLYKLLPSSANLQFIFLSKSGMLEHSGQFVSLGDNMISILFIYSL
jgi:hypothetical protein